MAPRRFFSVHDAVKRRKLQVVLLWLILRDFITDSIHRGSQLDFVGKPTHRCLQSLTALRAMPGRRRRDALDTLDLDLAATKEDIRQRYRVLVATEHPDVNKDDPNAEERFLQITTAYDVLMKSSDAAAGTWSYEMTESASKPRPRNAAERRKQEKMEATAGFLSYFAWPLLFIALVGGYVVSRLYCIAVDGDWCQAG
mmetsp:Transcript_42334/g.76812  ORF Transcript_42334/g.76812 Transcript_42334/m.76812 type:complete len:198 (+) Transcript_42334:46-639(+)